VSIVCIYKYDIDFMYLLRKVYTHIRILIGTSETYLNNKQKQYTVMLVLPASPTKTKNNTQWCSSYLQALQKPKTQRVSCWVGTSLY